jgi:SPP1 gp7 family putative phage head morphogenesis protein
LTEELPDFAKAAIHNAKVNAYNAGSEAAKWKYLAEKREREIKALNEKLNKQEAKPQLTDEQKRILAGDVRIINGKRTARPTRPNLGIEAEYKRRLKKLINEMDASILYWLKAAYKANDPHIKEAIKDLAEDALPANVLRRVIRLLARRWQRKFDRASLALAEWFSRAVHTRSTQQLHSILKRGGWSTELTLTKAQRDILQATIQQNVSLIRSIPSQHFTQIEGMVMRSVQTGRDLEQLTRDLRQSFGVTRRRAELIARDQNNKASSAMTRARQIELGIKTAIWVHSHAGKTPRPTHVAMNGQEFNVIDGWLDPAINRRIHPGELINCRCFSRPVIPGFS